MKWISVEERLPEKSGKYLVNNKYGIYVINYNYTMKEWYYDSSPV